MKNLLTIIPASLLTLTLTTACCQTPQISDLNTIKETETTKKPPLTKQKKHHLIHTRNKKL